MIRTIPSGFVRITAKGTAPSQKYDPRHDDDVALNQRPLEEPALHKILKAMAEGHLVTLLNHRGEHDFSSLTNVGLSHPDVTAEDDIRILPDAAVDAKDLR